MGYFLTTSVENAVPVESIVDPKTHGPLPQVQERGLRFYSPGVGRWLSRDPIGERGGANLFVYCGNEPSDGIDPLGLAHVQNNTGNTVLVLVNIALAEKCKKYIRDTYGVTLGDGINGVPYPVANGFNTSSDLRVTDVDAHWSAFPPGTGGFAIKIRVGKTLTTGNIATVRLFGVTLPWIGYVPSPFDDANVGTFSAGFLGGATLNNWVNTTINVTYRGYITAGVTACKCTQDDVNNLNHAFNMGTVALSLFPGAL